jgi:hypothetical protein
LATHVDAVANASRDAGAIPAASTFSEHASTGDKTRHETSKAVPSKEFVTHHDEGGSRQKAASSVMPRPPRATKSATRLMTEYPDLAVVSAARPELPEAVRAGIVVIVNAAAV